MATERKAILYIATSLDGYIAKPNDDMSFLSLVQEEGQDYGYVDFAKSVDIIVLGRKTYDWVLTQVPEFPHEGKEVYVITRTARPDLGLIRYHTGNLCDLISRLRREKGKNIFIDGGAEVVNELLKEKLIDEFYISIIPVLLGEGIRLFQDGRPEQLLKLLSAKQFNSGLTQLHYVAAQT